MARFVIKVDTEKLREAMRRAPKTVRRRLTEQLAREGGEWRSAMFDRFGGYSRQRGTGLGQRTGALRNSLGFDVSESADRVTLVVYSAGATYAPIQERGGTITARNGKYLTIPLPDNLTGAGVARFPSAAALRAEGRTFVLESKAGNLVIARRPPAGKKLEYLWLLKPSVVLPGPDSDGSRSRLGFEDTWDALEPDRRAGRTHALRTAIAQATQEGAR